MKVLGIQQQKSMLLPITKKVTTAKSNAAKKLDDVALTPWEFEKMISEPKANVVKKRASSGGADDRGCAHSESANVTVMGYDIC